MEYSTMGLASSISTVVDAARVCATQTKKSSLVRFTRHPIAVERKVDEGWVAEGKWSMLTCQYQYGAWPRDQLSKILDSLVSGSADFDYVPDSGG
jgi:hypothetical protein